MHIYDSRPSVVGLCTSSWSAWPGAQSGAIFPAPPRWQRWASAIAMAMEGVCVCVFGGGRLRPFIINVHRGVLTSSEPAQLTGWPAIQGRASGEGAPGAQIKKETAPLHTVQQHHTQKFTCGSKMEQGKRSLITTSLFYFKWSVRKRLFS